MHPRGGGAPGAHRPRASAAELAATLIASDDVLPDWYDDWIDTERERFQIRLHALERLCERLTVERRFGEALQAGLAALRTEPLRESAHR